MANATSFVPVDEEATATTFVPVEEAQPFGNVGSPSAQPSPINFGDMLHMAALGDQQGQQTYLESKFKFVSPITDEKGQPTGQFNVGDDPTDLKPIHPGGMGDAALAVLAKGAAMVPSIAGQMAGAAIGTVAEPGVGTVVGAAAGAAAGESWLKNTQKDTPGYNAEKAATDTVLAGLFGAAGEGLGQAVGFGVKNFIAPKLAAALDGAVSKSDNPSGAVALMTKVMKFVANVKQEAVEDGYAIGWNKIYANPKNLDEKEIFSIGQKVTDEYNRKEGLAKVILNNAEDKLLRDNPNATVKTSDILAGVVKRLDDATAVTTMEGDSETSALRFRFREDAPSGVNVPDMTKLLKRLGAQEIKGAEDKSAGKLFAIPVDATVPLRDALGAKKLFGQAFMNKEANRTISAIAKEAIYGEGPTAVYPNGIFGIRSALNDLASATKNDGYLFANENYSKLMSAKDGVIAPGKYAPGFLDVQNPENVAKYLSKIHDLNPYDKMALGNLQTQLGFDFTTPTREWAVAHAISKASPQMLRMGIVAGLLGLTGNPIAKVGVGFMAGSPIGIRGMAQLSESVGAQNLGKMGAKLLDSLAEKGTSPTGKAVLSQLLRKGTGN